MEGQAGLFCLCGALSEDTGSWRTEALGWHFPMLPWPLRLGPPPFCCPSWEPNRDGNKAQVKGPSRQATAHLSAPALYSRVIYFVCCVLSNSDDAWKLINKEVTAFRECRCCARRRRS